MTRYGTINTKSNPCSRCGKVDDVENCSLCRNRVRTRETYRRNRDADSEQYQKTRAKQTKRNKEATKTRQAERREEQRLANIVLPRFSDRPSAKHLAMYSEGRFVREFNRFVGSTK